MRVRSLAASLLAVCVLAGCAPAASSSPTVPPGGVAGRYAETDITPPGAQAMDTLLLQANGEFLDYIAQDTDGKKFHWRSTDGGDSWQPLEVCWGEGVAVPMLAVAPDGAVWFYYGYLEEDTGEAKTKFCRAAPGKAEQEQTGADWPDRLTGMQMLGDRLLLSWEDEDWQAGVFSQSGKLLQSLPLDETVSGKAADSVQLVAGGGNLFVKSSRRMENKADPSVLPLEEGQEMPPLDGAELETVDCLAADSAGSLYFLADEDIVRLSAGGNLREVVLERGQYAFDDPASRLDAMQITDSGDICLALSRDGETHLYCMRYDPTLPALPQGRLEVFSLYDTGTVRAAIAAFQQTHPDTLVEWQPALEKGADDRKKEDVLRTLNARLPGSNPPDVVVLDGMDIDSLEASGMLADLSGLVDTSALLPDVAESVHCALPTRFTLPVLLVEESEQAQFSDWCSVADALPGERMADNRITADPLPKDEQPAVFFGMPDTLTRALCAVYGEQLVQENSLHEQTALLFLQDAERVLDSCFTPLSETGGGPYLKTLTRPPSDSGSRSAFAQGQARTGFAELCSLDELYAAGARGVPVTALPLEGENGNVWLPQVTVGIPAACTQTELAADFVAAMLSEPVQEQVLEDGLPVCQSSFAAHWEKVCAPKPGQEDYTPFLASDPQTLANHMGKPLRLPDAVVLELSHAVENLRAGSTPQLELERLENALTLYFAEK